MADGTSNPRTPPVHTQILTASDGFKLTADWYAVPGSTKAILIAPATAVPRRFYSALAIALTERGFSVLVPDYRGIGDSRPKSLRGFKAKMSDWGLYDIDAALAFLVERGQAIGYIGHSAGGQLLPLSDHANHVQAFSIVASQSGWHGHSPTGERIKLLYGWYFLMPLLTLIAGRMPMSWLRQGLDIPAGVFWEWRRWCLSRNYLMDDPTLPRRERYAVFAKPMLAYSFADDPWATQVATAALLGFYSAADREHRHLTPKDVGLPRIGHFGFFSRQSSALWGGLIDWLDARVGSASASNVGHVAPANR
jgi:predicted alpha/beta hydrolase